MVLQSLTLLVAILSLAIGCSGVPATPVSPLASGPGALTADSLAGTWTLVSIQPADQAAQATPAGASYTLTFADGRLSTRADCNMCGGTFAVDGQTLIAGPALACTRAACATMAFENVYTGLLGGESTVAVSEDGVLVLTSPRGVLRFRR
jgi:heat shock protein HslJ